MTTQLQLLREFPAKESPMRLGFKGNRSGSDKFITDGHVLLVKSAIVSGLADGIREDEKWVTRVKARQITDMLNPLKEQPTVQGWYLGYATVPGSFPDTEMDAGIIRDATGRLLIIDPHILWFAIYHTHLDTLWMVAGGGSRYTDQPLIFKRGEEFVGCMMPLRIPAHIFTGYDTSGDAVSLELP